MARSSASILAALALVAVTTAAMAPGLGGELLNWDDNRFVRDNPLIQGLSLSNVRAIFAGPHQEAYHPLHLLSYVIDHALFGLWAPGYKILNLLLYLLALLLLYRLMRRLELSPVAAFAGLLVFAVHPLHVETVVWVSARKEPLSLCFMLGAALLHLDSHTWRDARRWLALLLFGAALLTKTSTIVLPLLLLICDRAPQRGLARRLLALAPMLVLALAVGLYVTGLWQQNEMVRPRPQGIGGGVALVLSSIGHHLSQLLLPLGLSPVYAIDRGGNFGVTAGIGLAGLIGFGLLAWRSRPSRLPLAWLLLALLPVINLVPVYFFVQDRYAFIPSVALALAVAVGVRWVQRTGETGQNATARARWALGAVAAVTALFVVISGLQARHWRTSRSLWEHAVAVEPRSYYAHLALGHTRRQEGQAEMAMVSYRAAIRLQPQLPAARIALCLADAQRVAGQGAVTPIQRELQRRWLSAQELIQLSRQLLRRRQLICAALAESRAFDLQPPAPVERIASASRWTLAGQGQAALAQLGRVRPSTLPVGAQAAHLEVQAQALVLLGRRTEAVTAFSRSLALSPRSADALERAARQLQQLGRDELARFYRAHPRVHSTPHSTLAPHSAR